jgi:hypothetical protein
VTVSTRTWKTMMDLIVVALVAAAMLLLASCRDDTNASEKLDVTPSNESKGLGVEDMDSAEVVVTAYERARNAGDVGRVTALVVERLANEGEEAITEGWKEVRSTRFELKRIEKETENKAWAIGRYTVESEDGTVQTYDKWVFPLYKEDGQWKIDPDGAEEATRRWQEKRDAEDRTKE